jgi:transposase-like protein
MEREQFERVKSQVTAATAGQILELEDVTQRIIARQFTKLTLDTRTCPHCQGNNIVLHGKDQNGRQRFKCRGCRKTYNIMTGTPMARARKPEKWSKYLDCMTEHMSVRTIVASGIGVHQVTVWRWRHRFLKAAANDNAAVLSGVIEADETFFPRSFKGSRGWKKGKPPENRAARPRAWGATERGLSHAQVPVLTALDSSGGIYEVIISFPTGIESALEGRIAAGSVLCSDGSVAYEKVADKAGAEHRAIIVPTITPHAVKVNQIATPSRKTGRLGLGRVNNHHQRLKHLINERCRGVATKYLGNYLGWHRAMIRSGFDGKVLLILSLAQFGLLQMTSGEFPPSTSIRKLTD